MVVWVFLVSQCYLWGCLVCVPISLWCLSQEQEKFHSVQVGGSTLRAACHLPHTEVSVSYFRSF